VPEQVPEAEAYKAAQHATLAALAQIKKALGSFDRVEKFVKVEVSITPRAQHAHNVNRSYVQKGFVASSAGFNAQPRVINGCSDLLKELFEDRAGHARAAVGVNELPLGAAVEIAFIVAVRPE
jgi:enamine deaminase RidA (YjgF/YER057c/UK114 family)